MELNMQTIRYINLLDRASKVKTTKCYIYNNAIIFAVPKGLISKAIGPDAINIRRMQDSLGKRIRIIEEAKDIKDAERFLSDIVGPVKFKSLEVKDGVFVLTAGNTQNKANLIGRNKVRYLELSKIVDDAFGINLKII